MIPQAKKENNISLAYTDLVIERKPVLVYKAGSKIEFDPPKKALSSTMASDWSLFMEGLNSEMFQKISF